MRREQERPILDRFRIAAAVLVVCNHTSPLWSYTEAGDFWLTRVLARLAVPFFFMVSGYFLARGRSLGRFLRKTLVVYGAAILLYLPLNLYNGGYSPAEWLRKLLMDGTFYHLWYFPAVLLGTVVASALYRLGRPAVALTIAGLLYLVGLGGDSYYGIAAQIPVLKTLYHGIFTISSYTRNGLFFAPLFVLLGAVGVQWRRRQAAWGFLLTLVLMSGEGLWLHGLGVQRHDSMYLMLPLCMMFLFSWIQSRNSGRDRQMADLSLLLYLIHPWCIVLVRGCAKVAGLEAVLIENSLIHFGAVLVSSFCAARLLYSLYPIKPAPKSRAWRELDLDAIAHNAKQLQGALAPRCRLMAVVKADAYGHGAVPVARRLRREGVQGFAVACAAEGVTLRKHGIGGPILVLGYTPPNQAALLARWRLTQTVVDETHGRALNAQGIPLRVHLALDTGMHRLGVPCQNHAAIARMYKLPNLRIQGVFSHLCVADGTEPEDIQYTEEQLTRFYETLRWMRQSGLDPKETHIQASYGIWNLDRQPCTWARAGIALYGVTSDMAPTLHKLNLRPALSLWARVASIRTLGPGESAGYGRAFQPERETRLAVVTIGYGDGLPRMLAQQGGEVLVLGHRCPMVGRMCMDQLLVDVTDVPEVAAGDVVTIFGQNGRERIDAEEVAQKCGTITNELLSRMGTRAPVILKTKRSELISSTRG